MRFGDIARKDATGRGARRGIVVADRAVPIEQRSRRAFVRGLRMRRAHRRRKAEDRRHGEQKQTTSQVLAQSHDAPSLTAANRAVNRRRPHRIMSASALRIDVLGTPNRPP